ncbi:MAG: hypothetical protein M9894_03755 [Planctomycetes bacterium]|nr:hypothetical protein [Planctomycetota bacterium]
MSDAEQPTGVGLERGALARGARRALVRWALVAAAALPCVLAVGGRAEALLVAALLGALAAPGALLEERPPPASPLRLAGGVVLTLGLAVLLVVQAAYVAALLEGGLDAAYRAVEEALVEPVALLGKAALVGGGFVVALVARARDARLAEQGTFLLVRGGAVALVLGAGVALTRAAASPLAHECARLCFAFTVVAVGVAGILLGLFHVGDLVAPRRGA